MPGSGVLVLVSSPVQSKNSHNSRQEISGPGVSASNTMEQSGYSVTGDSDANPSSPRLFL